LDYLNDSQRGFIVNLDGTDDYLRQAAESTRGVSRSACTPYLSTDQPW